MEVDKILVVMCIACVCAAAVFFFLFALGGVIIGLVRRLHDYICNVLNIGNVEPKPRKPWQQK